MKRPRFNDARGAAVITGQPPFDFEGVSMRCFPLRAEMQVLSSFIDRFLNVMPPEIAHFRPMSPYVYLMILNYGQMSSEVGDSGWVSQNEVAFSVPLEWYEQRDGRMVFRDWASICPFIFVDDEMSQYTGREVYGWPKVHGNFGGAGTSFTHHPRDPMHLLRFSTKVFPRIYAGFRKSERTVLEVVQDPPPTWTQMPPDPRNPLNPLLAFPTAMAEAAGLMMEGLDAMMRVPVRGYGPNSGPEPWLDRIQQALNDFELFGALPFFNTINLKQFRDTEEPDRACYQAVVNSKMTLTRLSEAGLLGDMQRLNGRSSAGYRIRITEYESFPVVSALGLQPVRVEECDEGDGELRRVAVLEPVMPFWSNVDFKYDVGEVLGQREKHSAWVVPGDGEERKDRIVGEPEPGGSRFNNTSGAASISVSGPFFFPRSSVRVLPLRASKAKLEEFVDRYLNEGQPKDGLRFRPWASGCCDTAYVYLTAQTFGSMSSRGMDLGQWADRSVRFLVPITWTNRRGERCVGTLSPFVYSDSQVGTATGREWLGWPTELARIDSPPDHWMAPEGPGSRPQSLLTVTCQALSGLGAGSERVDQRLLEITEEDVLPDSDDRWALVSESWGHRLRRDLERKQGLAREHRDELADLKALALEVLTQRRPLNDIALKQFRSSDRPDRACYQELVQGTMTLDHLWDMEELEDPMHVRIHRLASQPIVETLGLEVKHEEVGDQGTVYWLQPIRPFWFNADISAHGGRRLAHRSSSEEWQVAEDPPASYFAEDGFESRVSRLLVKRLEEEDRKGPVAEERLLERHTPRQQPARFVRDWWHQVDEGKLPERPLGRDEALRAVESLTPDLALDSILSAEWGHRRDSRLLRQVALHETGVEQKPEWCVRRDSVGPEADEVFPLPPGDGAYRCAVDDAAGWYPGEKMSKDGDHPPVTPKKKTPSRRPPKPPS